MMVNGKFAHCDNVNRLSVNLFCIYVVLKYTIIIIIQEGPLSPDRVPKSPKKSVQNDKKKVFQNG